MGANSNHGDGQVRHIRGETIGVCVCYQFFIQSVSILHTNSKQHLVKRMLAGRELGGWMPPSSSTPCSPPPGTLTLCKIRNEKQENCCLIAHPPEAQRLNPFQLLKLAQLAGGVALTQDRQVIFLKGREAEGRERSEDSAADTCPQPHPSHKQLLFCKQASLHPHPHAVPVVLNLQQRLAAVLDRHSAGRHGATAVTACHDCQEQGSARTMGRAGAAMQQRLPARHSGGAARSCGGTQQ